MIITLPFLARWCSALLLSLLPLVASQAHARTAGDGTFAVGPEETVLTTSQLAALHFGGNWPDSQLGVVPLDAPHTGDNHYLFVSAAGDGRGSPGITAGTLDHPTAGGVTVTAPIVDGNGTPIATTKYTYAGSGSIYVDPHSGLWLQFYHAEHTLPGDTVGNFYSVVGLATSGDRGHSWRDLGEIITPQVPYALWLASVSATPTTFAEIEISDASHAIVRDNGVPYIYVYFHDAYPPYPYQGNAFLVEVARARLDDVVDAARRRTTVPWAKYDNGAWSQPGLGGQSSSLEAGTPLADGGMFVSYNTYRHRYIMTVASGYTSPPGLFLTESVDGVHWGPRQLLVADPLDPNGAATILYPTIVGQGERPTVSGHQFYIYWTKDAFNAGCCLGVARRLITYN